MAEYDALHAKIASLSAELGADLDALPGAEYPAQGAAKMAARKQAR